LFMAKFIHIVNKDELVVLRSDATKRKKEESTEIAGTKGTLQIDKPA
jgi:hypothetical protein